MSHVASVRGTAEGYATAWRIIASAQVLRILRFPPEQWRSIHTTNAIERLHEEFKRRRSPASGSIDNYPRGTLLH
jgi:transposase-like protein